MAEFHFPEDVVASEFATIRVTIDHDGNGPRLKLTDVRTRRVAFFDALELETLIWLPEGFLEALQDPSSIRWRDAPETLLA
jgi:hypothetical protein